MLTSENSARFGVFAYPPISMANAIEVGLRGEARMIVGVSDTAISHGTGTVAVFATP